LPLHTGAEARVRNDGARLAAVLVNGGTGRPVPGTWSATGELLADELAARHRDVLFVEVRYQVKSWNELPSCMADGEAAVEFALDAGAEACLLVGFSMGGAVSVGIAVHDAVRGVLGLAPWLPERLPMDSLRGKGFDVVHGAWDRPLPGVPGVTAASSRAGFERALDAGSEGTYTLIRRGLHGAAIRSPRGRLVRLPYWRSWVEHVDAALTRFEAAAADLPA
jgi:pimeloyl-ACP methyl ester carboxylesterase